MEKYYKYIVFIIFLLFQYDIIIQNIVDHYELLFYRRVSLYGFNTFVLSDKINEDNVDKLISQIKDSIFVKIPIQHTLRIVINSPGGNLYHGLRLIDTMITLHQVHFECYAISASSIAFDIFQHCHTRFIIPGSYLMQHNASIKFEGSFEAFEEYYKRIKSLENLNIKLDKYVANKINMSYKEYKTKISTDWRITGKDIIKYKLADEIVIIRDLQFLF